MEAFLQQVPSHITTNKFYHYLPYIHFHENDDDNLGGGRRESQYRTQTRKRKIEERVCKKIKIDHEYRAEGKNKMQATGSLAVPVLRCSFGILNWHREEI
jgi:hypothetical protein